MSGTAVLLDTDTLSLLSRGHPRVTTRARQYLQRHGRLTLSAVTVFERLRGYRDAIGRGSPLAEPLQAFQALAAASIVLPLDAAAADHAATIWALASPRRRRALGDILIAATARAAGLPLVTRNVRDFHWLADLIDLEISSWAD